VVFHIHRWLSNGCTPTDHDKSIHFSLPIHLYLKDDDIISETFCTSVSIRIKMFKAAKQLHYIFCGLLLAIPELVLDVLLLTLNHYVLVMS